MESYRELAKVFSRLHRLEHLQAIVNWDAMVNMPPKGAEARGAALAELKVLCHNTITDPHVSSMLRSVEAATIPSLSEWETANVREMRRAVDKATRLPADLVERRELATNRAEQAWRVARSSNDWNSFLPHLREVVNVSRRMGALLAAGTDLHPYEALIDLYEPGMRVSTLDSVFNNIKSWLPSLIQEVMAKQKTALVIEPLAGPFPVEKQKEIGSLCMNTWQFDFGGGRLDVSSHPFCGGVPEDVRITTRYQLDSFDQSLMGVIHETGHAKYEQGRPREWLDQPVSGARSMGVHESQSLFAEMQVGRSAHFLRFLGPHIRRLFGESSALSDDNLIRLYRRVRPGLIRVDADELCYPLHVILRYEIERSLMDESLEVEDIPRVWDSKMKEFFSLDTEGNFKDGPLQDIHWSLGAIGYFPTYTLGAIYAAQMMAAVRRDLGDEVVDDSLLSGRLDPILAWQRDNVWSLGSRLKTDELLTRATGETLNVAHYRQHLERRYRDLAS